MNALPWGTWQNHESALPATLLLPAKLNRSQFDGHKLPTVSLPKRFVIDGRALEQLDSVGLAALCVLLEQANAQQCAYSWHNMPPIFQQLSKLYHLPFSFSSTSQTT